MTGLETGTLKKTCRSLFRAPQCLYLHDPQWVENGPAVFFQNSVGSQSLRGALAGVLLLLVLTSCGQKHVDAPPRTPEESLRSIQINPDFKIELVASEPLVYDPVEMVFDENGRLFVAEMLDYPDDPPPGEAARSRIVMLEDTNSDGIFDRRTVFAEKVLEVSGLMPWKGGLIVTSAPDILYMKDTTGDGAADQRKVLYTGFPKVNPEARITNPRLNLDNWVYCSNEGRDGSITSPDQPQHPPVQVRGADFRFRPDRGDFEPASGPTQFGQAVDEWGNRFITQNTVHIRQVVLPMQYLLRAPTLDTGAVSQDISDHGRPSVQMFPLTQPQAWRRQRTKLRQERYDENKLDRTEYVGGYITAASGGTIYDGDVFPKQYQGNVFTGDVSGSLVHRDVLTREGLNFIAHRGEEGKEFLASTDVWFRPCNFAVGPDGNLYLSDIYREFIETPESIPEEIKKKMDFWSGVDKGRIYRIVPKNPLKRRDLRPNLGKASSSDLVNLLASTNGWHRNTAHRLLMERQDKSVIPQLQQMAGSHAVPNARAQALWILESMRALDEKLIEHALADPDPNVRAQAIRLADPKQLPKLVKDPDDRVQFQLALSIGPNPRILGEILDHHPDDRWFRLAALSSVPSNPLELFQQIHNFGEKPDLLMQLGSQIGTRHEPKELATFLGTIGRTPKPQAALAGLARGLQLAGVTQLKVPGAEAALSKYLQADGTAAWDVARHLELATLVDRAKQDAQNPNMPVKTRVTAIRALRGGRYTAVNQILTKLIASQEGSEIQGAAIESLGSFDDPKIANTLIENWKGYGPEARRQAIAALMTRKERIPVLQAAVQKGLIEANAIDIAARGRLFPEQNSTRAKVVTAYKDSLKLTGDINRGKKLFEDNCGKCHLPRHQGTRVGPDLSGINNKTKEELLTSILNPSYAIEPRYTYYIVTTKDGQLYDGVIASETPGIITLRGGTEDKDETILRKNIAEIRASNLSLMPEGLEDNLGKQGVADVITYLRGGL
jgi:putative membrane-bound dehydrogenase-like protein